jgi:uncharacterized protein YjbJ (UPF0337 family)
MSRLQEKAQAKTRQAIGQMIGDDRLVLEGKEQERHAEERQRDADENASADRNKASE